MQCARRRVEWVVKAGETCELSIVRAELHNHVRPVMRQLRCRLRRGRRPFRGLLCGRLLHLGWSFRSRHG